MPANSCFTLISDAVTRGYGFVTSEPGDLCIAAIATVKAMTYYCGRSRYPETRELASIIIVGSILIGLIAVAESPVPNTVKEVLSCTRSGPLAADADMRVLRDGGER